MRWVMKSKRGFSFTELLVSLAISAGIGVIISFYFLMGRAERQLDKAKLELGMRSDAIISNLREAIDGAVRTAGFSTEVIDPANAIFLTPIVEEDSGTMREKLVLLSEKHPHVTAMIDAVNVGASGTYTLQVTNTSSSLDPLKERMQGAVRAYLEQTGTGIPILIHSQGESNLIKMAAGTWPTIWLVPIYLSGFARDATMQPRDPSEIKRILENNSRVAMLSEVEIFLENGQLKLRSRYGNQTHERILGTGVEGIKFKYNYSGFHRSAIVNLRIPSQGSDRPSLDDFVSSSCTQGDPSCCNPTLETCAELNDLSSIAIHLVTSSEFKSDVQGGSDLEGFHIEPNRIVKNSMFAVFPKNYNSRLENISQAISLECRDPAQRCKPGCADYFDSTDINSVKWVGYGRYAGSSSGTSNYCQCGTRIAGNPDSFTPPESYPDDLMAIRYDANSGADNRRINACIAHFDEYRPWAWMHPYPFLWWNFFSDEGKTLFRSGSRGNLQYSETFLNDFKRNYEEHGLDSINDASSWWDDDGRSLDNSRRIMECRLAYDGNSDFFRWAYNRDTRVQFPIGSTRQYSPATEDRNYRPGDEACLCRTDTGALLMNYVANHRYAIAGGNHATNAACPNTWNAGDWAVARGAGDPLDPGYPLSPVYPEGKKIYKVNGLPANPTDYHDGFLTVQDAALSQCLSEVYAGQNQVGTSHGWGVSLLWDWRIQGSDGTTQIPTAAMSGYIAPQTTFGNGNIVTSPPWSTVGRQVTVYYKTNPSEATPTRSPSFECARVDRFGYVNKCITGASGWHGPFDPTLARTNLGLVYAQKIGTDPNYSILAPGSRDAWANYCNPNCGREPYTENVERLIAQGYGIEQIRKFITGVGPSGQIPTWCAGYVQDGRPGF